MRILHVIHDHPNHPTIGGGGAVRVHEIAKRLAARGHDIQVACGWFEGCENPAHQGPSYRTTFLGPHRSPACKSVEFALAAWRHLAALAHDAEVVIEDFSPYAPVGAYRLQSTGKAIFLQIQNYVGKGFQSRHGWAGLPPRTIERWYPSLFRNHILVGEYLQTRFRAREKSWVIPMGFSDDLSNAVSAGSRDYIAFLGRTDFNQKGLDILLEALQGTELPVWFAGAGRETKRLETALARLPACRFLGRLQGRAKWDFLMGARFLVMPSRFEGQPIVAIEAAAAGTPILASSIPELDFVTAERIGRQFMPLEAGALREAMAKMWCSSEYLTAYTQAAELFARSRSWDRIAAQFESALLEGIREV